MADLRLNIIGDDKASDTVKKVKESIAGLAVGLAAFSAASVKAFEEQEAADRKLAAVAGEATEAFKKQASAIQDATGTSDDMVQEMQRMLLTYGEAPAAIDETIKAVLNMSAATGQDAVQAISELTSKTTTGRKAFIELGLQYDNTGTQGEVLARATQALGEKFAGASDAEANSLAGKVRKAKAQFSELQETWGGLVASIASKTGIIERATQVFQFFNEALNPSVADRRSDAVQKVFDIEKQIAELKGRELSEGEAIKLTNLRHELAEARKETELLTKAQEAQNKVAAVTLDTKGKADGLKAGTKNDRSAEEAKKKREEEERDAAERVAGKMRNIEITEAFAEQEAKALQRAEEKKAKIIERESEKIEKERERALEKEKQAIEKQTEQWRQAGAAIGGALAGALASALDQLSSGGELDATALTADILSAVVATAVSLIPGFGGFAGIAGQLTKTGVTAIGAAAGGGPKKRRHNGGWAGDGMARYHLGTWVGPDEEAAILQNGERVVSRSEVSAMGGPRGVEKAINGRGGGGVVNIQTFDAGSFREIFSGRGRQGLIDAQRTGHGVASFFGGR